MARDTNVLIQTIPTLAGARVLFTEYDEELGRDVTHRGTITSHDQVVVMVRHDDLDYEEAMPISRVTIELS